jgi:hypothetical protein
MQAILIPGCKNDREIIDGGDIGYEAIPFVFHF